MQRVKFSLLGMLVCFLVWLGIGLQSAKAQTSQNALKFAYAADLAPISSGEGKSVQGILPDLIREIIVKRMGVPVLHNGLPWARAQVHVERAQSDAFVTTPTQTRLIYTDRSEQTVLFVPFQAFAQKSSKAAKSLERGTPASQLRDYGFCDVLGNGWAKAFYAKRNIDYKVVPTLDSCLRLLAMGKTDIVIHATPVTLLFLNQTGLGQDIIQLSYIYPESPDFPLLLSKRSDFGQSFLDQFDQTVKALKSDGSYDRLLQQLIAKHVAVGDN